MKKSALLFSSLLILSILALPAFAQDDDGYSHGYATSPSAAPGGVGVNYEMRLGAIEDHMRALNGKVEQLEYAMRRLDQTLTRLQTDYEARLTKLETAPPPAPPAPPQAATQPPTAVVHESADDEETAAETTPSGQLGNLKMRGGKVTGGNVDPKTSPLPKKPADYGLNAQEQYDRAFGLLRQANYDEAEKAFKSFIDKNPQDKLIDNAKYWHGETFYVRGKFNDAALAFADAYQQNPKGTKAPDSLLKLGMSLSALGKTTDACTTFASMKKTFPNAPVTLRSRVDQERARLKCK